MDASRIAGGPVTFDASAAGRAPTATGRGPGLRGAAGGTAHLAGLLDAGLDVDGVLVTLGEVGALGLGGGVDVDGRFATGGAVDGWITTEHETLGPDGGETSVTVRVRGAGASEARGALDVHLVLDRSSSMQGSWAEAIDAAKLLIDRLAPTDRIHVVAYGPRGVQIVAPRLVGDGVVVRRALDRIAVGGGTNIEAGLDIAYREVSSAPTPFRGRSVVILVSDGVPNEGELGAAGLSAMAGHARVRSGCTTTVVGLGDQFDAEILSSLAAEGRGGYYLARTAHELAPALAAELTAHARIAARDVDLSLDLGDGVELLDVFDGATGTSTVDGGVRLTMPKLAAGEERRFVVRVRVAPGYATRRIVGVRLGYRAGGRAQLASGHVAIGFGAHATLSAGAGSHHAVDADLGRALAHAGRAVRYGNGAEAAATLRGHVDRARRHHAHRAGYPLHHRTAAVERLAIAVEGLVPGATYQERRQVGLALGAVSIRFGR